MTFPRQQRTRPARFRDPATRVGCDPLQKSDCASSWRIADLSGELRAEIARGHLQQTPDPFSTAARVPLRLPPATDRAGWSRSVEECRSLYRAIPAAALA